MILFKDNVPWCKDENEILNEFCRSDLFTQRNLDESARLALFVAYDPPRGLGSAIISGPQFNKLVNYYEMNKHQFVEQHVQSAVFIHQLKQI